MTGAPDQDEYDPFEGTEGAGLAHIARPGVGDTSSAVPASAVRALPAPSATSISPATSARTAADEAELNRLQTTGSGISQIKNPIARGALRGLNVAGEVGSAFLPELRPVLNAIPGTEEHHQQLIKTETGRLGTDLGAEDKEAAVGKTAADTSEATARANLAQAQADVAKNPKTGLTGEELTIHDLMTGDNGKPRVNPKTDQPYTYLDAYTAVNEAKENAKPTKPEKPDTPEQQLLDAEQAVAQAKTPEEKKTAQANLDRLKKSISEYSGLTAKPEKSSVQQARSDRSYTYNNNKLDTLAKPIEDAEARMGRLRESLAQGTPQADALVAPELLTIMAGGAGSGLRMNEAEISRIVGGRSKWQSLETAINQWKLDPTKANSITPEQRQQIRDLTEAVNAKLQKKQQALDQAREDLLNSDDPKEHRKIVTNAHHSLTEIDEGGGGENQNAGAGGVEYKPGLIRNGYKFKGGDPTDQKNWEPVQKKEAATK